MTADDVDRSSAEDRAAPGDDAADAPTSAARRAS